MASRSIWASLFASLALSACSLVVDFDRAKLRPDAATADDAGSSDGGPKVDAGKPDAGRVDAGGGTGEAGVDAGGRCTDDSQCGAEDLCCGGVCTPALVNNGCASCTGSACGDGADSCSARACSCGGAAACTAATPYCAEKAGGAPGETVCVACRGDADCGTDSICVQQQCRACDHTKGDNSGCKNPTPICADDDTCVACDGDHACPGTLSCSTSGTDRGCFGCDDASNVGCQAASTTPVCDPGTGGLQCEACAADGECTGNGNGAQCLANGSCRVCDPRDTTNPGCTDASKSFCDQNGACRGCVNSDCTGSTSRCAVSGALVGRCVGCTGNDQCPTTAPTCGPTTGTCRACTSDTECTGSPYGARCNGSGRCVQCTANSQCGGTSPRCDTASNTCVECTSSSQCSGAQPICEGGACKACGAVGGDAACLMKNGSFPACASGGSCVQCTSATACNDGNACTTDSCVGNACVNAPVVVDDSNLCTTDSCVPATGVVHAPCATGTTCVTGVGCRACNPTTNAGCTASTQICNPATYTCEAAPPPSDAGM